MLAAHGAVAAVAGQDDRGGSTVPEHASTIELFETSDVCLGCHNGVTAATGEDISIGFDWRATMMANSARDPYWHAAVRREIMDNPSAGAQIQDECAACHMPMARYTAHQAGQLGQVFANLSADVTASPWAAAAMDGVSCSVCHLIASEGVGDPSSFTGRFLIDGGTPERERLIYGPFEVDEGRARLMQSASGFRPAQSAHVQSSELCASCHTLYTHPLDEDGNVIGELPEQVPYLEWQHSDYRETRSCQSCHMPVVPSPAPVTSVLGQPRDSVSRHVFQGGNFFMLRMLNRYRAELGVTALPQELTTAATRTIEHLRTSTARLRVERLERARGAASFDVVVENLAGHKLPTAYPSRRAWLHVVVRDGDGSVVFESGALRPDGSIVGSDADGDPDAFEPHHLVVRTSGDVQIYESVMQDADGRPTTALLRGVTYIKDNRVLPTGFDKATADPDIAVRGGASDDGDFVGGSDRTRYEVAVDGATGSLTVEVGLWYQPISYRWARNLDDYAHEPESARFLRYYDSMASASGLRIASVTARLP
jgi:hypothetical protein